MKKQKFSTKTISFILLTCIMFLATGCPPDNNSKPKMVPKNGAWFGQYTGVSTPYSDDIAFYIKSGRITNNGSTIKNEDDILSMYIIIYYSNVTITYYVHNDVNISDASFLYTRGDVTSGSGQVTIKGTFTSPTTCTGKVTHEVNSSDLGQGNTSFDFTASFVNDKSIRSIQTNGKQMQIINRSDNSVILKTQNNIEGLNTIYDKK